MKIKIGTRGSELALWQAEHVAGLLGKERTEIIIIKTKGDRILNVSFDKMEGKGFFTKEIEAALLENRIDLAVHSLKDLTTEEIPGLQVAAITEREDPSDVLLIRKHAISRDKRIPLADNSTVGTSSMRRMAQIRRINPTLKVKALRGNINTRIRKLTQGEYDAIILAYAGVKRIGVDTGDLEQFILPHDLFIPAPAQGALALQVRTADEKTAAAVRSLNHEKTAIEVRAERSFLNCFGGGCHIPLGALALLEDGIIRLTGIVASTDGIKAVIESVAGSDPEKTGAELADIIKAKGADKII